MIVGVGVRVGRAGKVDGGTDLGTRVGVLVRIAVGVLVGDFTGVIEGVIRLASLSMRGTTHRGLSASAEPLARTVRMNVTFLPANELRSRSTL